VIEAWRELSSTEPVLDDSEYYTDQFLSLDCYGALVAEPASEYLSFEDVPSSGQVLVHFTGGVGGMRPGVALFGCLPVLGKPGRLAAQLYLTFCLDPALARFADVRRALSDGFIMAYGREADGGGGEVPVASLRLRIHAVLCLLELLWSRRQALGTAAAPARSASESISSGSTGAPTPLVGAPALSVDSVSGGGHGAAVVLDEDRLRDLLHEEVLLAAGMWRTLRGLSSGRDNASDGSVPQAKAAAARAGH